MAEKEGRTVIGVDWGNGPSQTAYTFYTMKPRYYAADFSGIPTAAQPKTSDRKLWGIELLIDLRAALPGPDQKKYQRAQFNIRKARANEAR